MTQRSQPSLRPAVAALSALTVLLAAAGCSRPTQESAVSPAASSTAQTSPAASAVVPMPNVSDADVTGNVSRALQNSESLKGQVITVATFQGEVRLTGTLDNQLQVDDAVRLARAAEGAHTVRDDLTLRK